MVNEQWLHSSGHCEGHRCRTRLKTERNKEYINKIAKLNLLSIDGGILVANVKDILHSGRKELHFQNDVAHGINRTSAARH